MKLEDVIHEPVTEFLHVFLSPLSAYEFTPSRKKVLDGYDIFEGMSYPSPAILPVIEHMLGVYKTWHGFRDSLPKKSRYTLGDKIDSRFIQVLELLYTAGYQSVNEKLPTIERALSGTDTLKFLLRIAWELRALDNKKYVALSEGLHEVGRQIGGWRKGLQTKTSAKS